MSLYRQEIGEKLNALLKKTYDAEKGYHKAAENAKTPNLKIFFERKSKERKAFAQALRSEVANYGQEADTVGNPTGSMHRAWMDVKAFLSKDNDKAMLEETISGEKSVIKEYREVLQERDIPSSTSLLLQQQMGIIENDLIEVKTLDDLS